MNIELAHRIFGHRAVSSLLAASDAEVWDDVTLVMAGDSWCDKCKIAIAPRTSTSKLPMRIHAKPLQHIFIDCIPCPGTLPGVKECMAKDFYFLCCPTSKFVTKLNATDKSTATAIKVLLSWRGEMLKKGFPLFLYLRSDAGTQFTSSEFKQWCDKEHIKLTIAGPKHQEQNAFVENAYRTSGRMARSMLITAHLPIHFYIEKRSQQNLDQAVLSSHTLPGQ